MTIPDGSLHLYLTFRDKLEKIEVLTGTLAATRETDDPVLSLKGTVGGAEELESLLEAASVDHVQVAPGDAGTSSASMAIACGPRRIVEELKEKFAKDAEISQKVLDGKELTEDEKSFKPPKSLTVYASSVPTARGAESVAAWFKKKAGDNRAQPATA